MRTFSSLNRRRVETESGRRLGRCRDLQGELHGTTLQVTGLCVGRNAWLSHLGIRPSHKPNIVPWQAVVRIEGKRIIVKDQTYRAGNAD